MDVNLLLQSANDIKRYAESINNLRMTLYAIHIIKGLELSITKEKLPPKKTV